MTEEEGAEQSPDANSSDKKAFGKDVGKLVSGTVVAQVVGICLTPIITRIFSPEIYGVASVFISIVSIITVIACMRYELAILLPKDDKDAGAVFLLCLMILVCVSLVSIPVMFLCGDLIADMLGNAAVKDYLFLVPVAVFIDGLYLALRYWNTRRKRFGTQATTQALQSITGSGLKLGFGSIGFVIPGSLIIGGILGNGLGMLFLLVKVIWQDFLLIRESISFGNIKRQMIRYKNFPLIDAGSNLLNVVSWQLPVLMLTGFFSSTVAGLYTLGFQMIQMPMNLIGGSIGQVFLQRASVAKHDGSLDCLVEDVSKVLLLIGIGPIFLLMTTGGTIFSVIFGIEWYEAGIYCQILSIWVLVWFISSPLSTLTAVLEIQGFGMKITSLNLITRFISLGIGGFFGNVLLALFLFALSGILVYGIQLCYLYRKVNASLWRVLYSIRKWFLLSVLISICFITLNIVNVNCVIIVILVCFSGVGYYLLLFMKNKEVKLYIK
jgi:O-antigen/teichoic acid export membrane protein